MPNREKIVHTLLREEWVSGSDMARRLGISRTAIWNYIEDLKQKGYIIESHSKKGYKLGKYPPFLHSELVSHKLPVRRIGKRIVHYMSIGSTNDEALRMGLDGALDGTVVIAEEQIRGKGRFNRVWESVSGKNLLCSVLLKPQGFRPRDAYQFTMLAAIGVVEAISQTTELQPVIKWPNDVYINNHKAAGILTEMNAEMDFIRSIVIGIGVNVNQTADEFPEEVDKAGSLCMFTRTCVDRLKFCKNLLICLDKWYDRLLNGNFMSLFNAWKEKCTSIGKRVAFRSGILSGEGIILDIVQDGGLVVLPSDSKETKILYSGDIRILDI